MKIDKIVAYILVCPHCGAKIKISAEEYDKYKQETKDYSGSTILCTEENEEENSYEITYINFVCPVCEGYIPATVSEYCETCDADKFGFKYSKHIEPIYVVEDKSIEEYLGETFFENE